MKKIKIFVFLPLLLLYVSLILMFSSNELKHDEPAYLSYAHNLSEGQYTPKDNIDLTKPPGYPIFLLFFVALKIPLIIPKLLNAIFLFLAVIYFYNTILFYIDTKYALICSYLLGLYPPALLWLPLLITESIALFLVCGFVFHFCSLINQKKFSWTHLLATSFYLAYLALTKTIFGYIIIAGIAILLISYLILRTTPASRSLTAYVCALLFCLPYLGYTFTLTGKVFYWGTNGGEMLYWMSSPYPKEFGDWHMEKDVLDPKVSPELYKNHGVFFKEISSLSQFEKDKIFRQRAIDNVIHHPVKFVQNWMANVGRLVFNYPYSYEPQTLPKYFHIIPNMFLIGLALLCAYPAYIGRKLIPYEIITVAVFALIYLGGNSIVSARSRYFIMIVPIFMICVSYVLRHIIRLDIRK